MEGLAQAVLLIGQAALGDKTQLAAATLASRTSGPGLLAVWPGASAGMLAANVAAIMVGQVLGTRLPQRAIKVAAGVLFVVFGGWTLAAAV